MASPITNTTNYAVACVAEHASGRVQLHTVVKSTWQPADAGAPLLAQQQAPVRLSDEPDHRWGGTRYASDAGPGKRGCGVVVIGAARMASGGERRVSVSVAGRTLHLRVRHLGAASAAPVEVPLVYALAEDAVQGDAAQREGDALPARIAWDTAEFSVPRDAPAGFGFVPVHFACRAKHWGRNDEAWMRARMPLPPVDHDVRFGNVANPALQFASAPLAGQLLSVEGMTPQRWELRVPPFSPKLTATYSDGSRERKPAIVDTLVLEPEAGADGVGRLMMTARGHFALGREGQALQHVEVANG